MQSGDVIGGVGVGGDGILVLPKPEPKLNKEFRLLVIIRCIQRTNPRQTELF